MFIGYFLVINLILFRRFAFSSFKLRVISFETVKGRERKVGLSDHLGESNTKKPYLPILKAVEAFIGKKPKKFK